MKINTNPQKIQEVLTRGVEEIIDENHLRKRMERGDQLRVKLGIDPTTADLHLGHSVVLRKLAQFQELGHKAVLIIGDFTTRIGDPSGRMKARKPLTKEKIKENMKDYITQASKIIDVNAAEIHYNSEWFDCEPVSFIMDLAGRFTIARLIEREDFQKRITQGLDVSMLELLYPLLQGYDSVACRADVELGGYDQRLNVLFARRVQKKFNIPEQDVVMTPLLIGIDGEKKMSKSIGNYIRLTEKPNKMFIQVMTIPDVLLWNYFELLTEVSKKQIGLYKKRMEDNNIHPKDIKKLLATEIVEGYYGKRAAEAAEAEFVRVAQKKELPSEIPTVALKVFSLNILDLLAATGGVASKSEAKRIVIQNGIRIDGVLKNNWKAKIEIKKGQIVQIGKNKFFKII